MCIVRVDYAGVGCPSLGMVTSVTAKDAVAIPVSLDWPTLRPADLSLSRFQHLNLVAILEYNGKVTLYSGLTLVGKLHIGGVLAQHNPPHVMHHLPQFNSPFPRYASIKK